MTRYRSYLDRDRILHPKIDVASPSARHERFLAIWRSGMGGVGVLILQFTADKSIYLMVVQRAQIEPIGEPAERSVYADGAAFGKRR
jgi:hypothetical protein